MIPTQNPTANAGAPTLPVVFTGVLPAWQRFRGNNVNSGVYPSSLGALKTNVNAQMLGPVTPQIKWSRPMVTTDGGEGGGTVSSPVVDSSGYMYAATLDGKLLKYFPNGVVASGVIPNGRSSWYSGGGGLAINGANMYYAQNVWGYFVSTPMLDNLQDMLYVGNTDGYLYKYTVKPTFKSGTPVWKFKTNGAIVSSPIQTNSTRISLVVVGSMDGNVYAVNDGPVNTLTPTMVWVYPTGGL